jgi:23S rRNA (uracil1939-C5)-methyltransferase
MENVEKTAVMPSLDDQLELEILRVSSGGGRGVAKHSGLVVFVPSTAPGDLVRVKVTKVKKSFLEAELLEILTPSPSRIEPPCPVFESCGGCSLQMITYDEQLKQKEGFLDFSLSRIFEGKNFKREEIEPSPKEFRYRNRIQLHQRGSEIGFFKKKTNSLVSFDDCLITDERITGQFEKIKEKNKDRRVELALNTNHDVVVREQKLDPAEALFAQVNTGMNKILVDYVMKNVSELNTLSNSLETIFDLYAGAGNFSFPLAEQNPEAQITAVELSTASVKRAEATNDFSNLRFKAQDVAKFLKHHDVSADLVLLDPPRKGLSKEVVQSLLDARPKHIFYISCDLSSVARDLEILSEVYNLKKVKAFDMFPQTDHMETFFHLERMKKR